MKKTLLGCLLVSLMILTSGCYLAEIIENWGNNNNNGNNDDPVVDSLPEIQWLGQSYQNTPRDPSAVIRSGSIDEKFTYQDYTLPSSWPKKTVGSANCQGIFCLFYEKDGKIVGGKFDWARSSGQPVKTIENVHHGYQGHTMPAKGTKCYLMLVNVNGSLRTNFIEINWK